MSAHKPHFVLSLDQGTTGTTALLLDLGSKPHKVVSTGSQEFLQHYPSSDWVEHNLEEIKISCEAAIKSCLKQASEALPHFTPDQIETLGITNQRETLCVFEKGTGKPLRNAIVWQCKRSSKICKKLKEEGLGKKIKEKTGLLLDPYFTGSKVKWILEEEKELADKIKSGKALLGTIDTFLLYWLTKGESFFTEPSNASRTLLYNIKEKKWDSELLALMGGVPESSLPKVIPSDSLFGKTKGLSFLPEGLPIHGILGDQQASLFGQACFKKGESKCTYGTGAFFLMNTGEKAISSEEGLLSTVAWELTKEGVSYALEGSCFIAGAAVGFLRDNLKLIESVKETGEIPEDTEAAPEVYFVPALTGLGAPYWKPGAKGMILGLTRSTTKEQIMKATLEGICFQVEDLLMTFKKDSGFKLEALCVDGGATGNEILMNTQSELSALKILRPEILESTAYGAALISAYGSGFIKSLEDLKKQKTVGKAFNVTLTKEGQEKRKEKLQGWKQAVGYLLGEGSK